MKIELSEREIEILRRALREDVLGNLESKIKMNENAELPIWLIAMCGRYISWVRFKEAGIYGTTEQQLRNQYIIIQK